MSKIAFLRAGKLAYALCVLLCLVGCDGEYRVLERQYGDHFHVEEGVPVYLCRPDHPDFKKVRTELRGIEDEYILEDPEFLIDEVRWDEENEVYLIYWQDTNVGERLEEFEEACIEQEINGEWYKVVTSPGVTAVRKTISPGETIKKCVHLNNAADLDKRMPDGKYRLVRKLYKDWSEGTTYYAVAEFEIESRSR